MKKAMISVITVLAVFLTYSFGFTHGFRAPDGVSNAPAEPQTAPSPSARLKNIFGPLEHEVVVMPWGNSLSRLARTLGRENQKQINEFIDEVEALNTNNSCFKSRDLVWEGCKVKTPSYKNREVQIRFAAANTVNDALANDANKARAETTQSQTSTRSLIAVLIAAIIVIIVLAYVLVFVDPVNQTYQKELVAEKEKNKKLEEEKALADAEIKRLNEESNGFVERMNKLYTEQDRLRKDLQQKVSAGDTIELESREGGRIKFKVHEVLCPHEQCQTPLKPANALSHYFKPHNSPPAESPA